MAEDTGEFDGPMDKPKSSPSPTRLPSSADAEAEGTEGVGEKVRLGSGGERVVGDRADRAELGGEPARVEDSAGVGETPPPRAGPKTSPCTLPTSLRGSVAKVWSKPPPVSARDLAGEIGLKSVEQYDPSYDPLLPPSPVGVPVGDKRDDPTRSPTGADFMGEGVRACLPPP